MAFRSNGPVVLAFPAFRGVVRRIILIAIAAFFALIVLHLLSPDIANTLIGLLFLQPESVRHGRVWVLLTYPFVSTNFLSVAFSALTVWMFGSQVEDDRGASWLQDYFLLCTLGGALIASLLAYAVNGHIPGLHPSSPALGLWPFALAIMLAFAHANPDQELTFNFLFRIRAKYLVAIYLLGYLFLALRGGDPFGALLALTNALVGYLVLRFVPRRGLRYLLSERLYGLRNSYYRRKRKNAAKKFEVYMRDNQGKDVHISDDDRNRWMN